MRRTVRGMVDERDVAQARTVHYALAHAAARTRLSLMRDGAGRPQGFVAACVTGMNPFQPVVVFQAEDEAQADLLFSEGLGAGPSYLFMAETRWAEFLERRLNAKATFARIFVLEPGRLQPVVNLFVRTNRGADGSPQATIAAQGRTVVRAGVNWQGERFAELYAILDPAARGREWGRSVLCAVAQAVQSRGVRPLLYVPQDGADGAEMADAALKLGFTDSGRMALQIAGALMPSQPSS
ncbi:MAG: hypothetical protein KA003_13050 [Caldilineaceae bacterium]|nr:hypothetical protein [Caldilineaceae bacterium]